MTTPPLYSVQIKRGAEKELNRLPDDVFARIDKRILELERQPRPVDCKKLRGTNEYRIRFGDYRVVYTVNDRTKVVEIVSIGHRSDIYRNR